ncbi:MAG: RsmE family RNA methyltransferase [Saprospiraceae bacterium]
MGVNSLHWYYVPALGHVGEFIPMAGDEWHHCTNVMRLTPGDRIILTDGKGQCFEGMISKASAKEGSVELINDVSRIFAAERHYKVSIGIAPTKNIDRTEFAVEKITELGVNEICFLNCQHGERNKLRMDRFEKIVIAAAKQSRKTIFPSLVELTNPLQWIRQKTAENPDQSILCCHLDPESIPLFENYLAGRDVVILIGPEGGFSSDEIKSMKEAKAQLVHLGPFRLRVETAVISACANIHLINEMKSNE